MKNKVTLVVSLSFILFAALGCSSFNPLGGDSTSNGSQSNKSLSDQAVDVAVGESKVGIPECDELIDQINLELNNPDDGFVAKAFKRKILNGVKDKIRTSLASNSEKDREDMIKTCREFKAEFDKFKNDEASKEKEAQ